MQRLIAARAKVFKALGHPNRLMMVDALSQGEQCVCELQRLVGKSVSTVSKHLAVLKEAGVICDEKRGLNVYYSLKMPCVAGFMDCLDRTLRQALHDQLQDLQPLPERQNLADLRE